jgi:hypothetical protein
MQVTEKRIRFDGTINLGHIITFLGFLGSGAVAWNAMDKRVVVLEEARVVQVLTDRRQDEDRADLRKEAKENSREINGKLDRLIERGLRK